jgi:molecular chaperone GrpE
MKQNQHPDHEEIVPENPVEQQPETPAEAFEEAAAEGTASLQNELDELKDKYLRLYAEFDNFRRRTAREKIEMGKTASRELMVALLPVLDDFERGIKNDPSVSEGMRLVYQKTFALLEQQGLKAMDSNGQPFDADLHEAITEFPAPVPDLKGKVVDTIEKGYYLHDVIIRYAKVVVGR